MSAILGPDGMPARVERRAPKAKAYLSAGWGQIYEAATRSDFRGFFYIPSLNPSEQLNDLSLRAIRERTDFLYANVGATRMLINRTALTESGVGMWPKWITESSEFNDAATDAYHFACHDPRFFSADQKSDAYSVQYGIRRLIKKGGDCFGQFLRPTPGSTFPRMALIPGWQCDNFGDEKPGEGWKDGVRTNDDGAALEYCFISTGADGKRQKQIVPADDVLHFTDPLLTGQRRGEPCLASVAKKMFRREDIGHAISNGTLARERLGFALESAAQSEDGGPSVDDVTGDGETETVTNEDGTKWTVKKIFGDRVQDEIEIPELPPGKTIRTIESNRPGTAVMEFQDSILREAAWAQMYPAEFVFFQAGIGQGTVAREVRLAAGEVISMTREFQMRPQFGIRWPVFWIWQLIKSGYFATLGIKVPKNWWRVRLIFPTMPTLDNGRDGNLNDNRVATGKKSIETYHGEQGEDAADVENENIDAIRRRFQKLKALNEEITKSGFAPLRYEDVWSRSINVPIQPVPAAPNEPPAP